MRQTPQNINGVEGWGMEAVTPVPFSKDNLLELYGKCHRHLHRGNVNKLLNSETPIEIHTNFPEIINWAQKITDLLSLHVIVIDQDKLMFCMLRNAENNNKVQAGFMVTVHLPWVRQVPGGSLAVRLSGHTRRFL
jgi:hypothetical protein